jgi:predicted RNase H-like HicB family nuclease
MSPSRGHLRTVSDEQAVPVPTGPTLTVRIRTDELDGGYIAECLELPGCVSEGESEEEALENLTEAVAGVLAVRFLKSVRASAKVHAASDPASVTTEHDHRVALFA